MCVCLTQEELFKVMRQQIAKGTDQKDMSFWISAAEPVRRRCCICALWPGKRCDFGCWQVSSCIWQTLLQCKSVQFERHVSLERLSMREASHCPQGCPSSLVLHWTDIDHQLRGSWRTDIVYSFGSFGSFLWEGKMRQSLPHRHYHEWVQRWCCVAPFNLWAFRITGEKGSL